MSQAAAKQAKIELLTPSVPLREWEYDGEKYWAATGAQPIRTGAVNPGIYHGYSTVRGTMLAPMNVINDKLLNLPNPHADRVLRSVRKFWKSRERYVKYGQLYKRGILMHGAPGSGKTVTLTFLSQDLVGDGGIVVYVDAPHIATSVLTEIREREPTRPIISVFEDLDIMIESYGDGHLTKLLDGEAKIDNVVYLATTNYLHKIKPRLRSRPSRFDEVLELPMPERETRYAYLKNMMSIDTLDESELEDWTDKSEGLSVAHLKELVISVKVLDNSFEDSLKRLKELGNIPAKIDEHEDDEKDDEQDND